jgi:chorismate mutase/prephenate dehydrogenase
MVASARALAEVREAGTRALVADVCSIKAPVLGELHRMARERMKVASLHPMWGPDAVLLSDKNLLVLDCGSRAAVRDAKALFRDTSVTIVEMHLDAHDRMISFVLGLAHASTIIFNRVLVESGLPVAELAKTSSTSFERQLSVSRLLAYENVDLYYEIQTLNEHAATVLGLLAKSAEEFRRLAATRDKRGFERWMADSRKLFEGLALVEAKRSPVAGT